jgi:hypothetical protein
VGVFLIYKESGLAWDGIMWQKLHVLPKLERQDGKDGRNYSIPQDGMVGRQRRQTAKKFFVLQSWDGKDGRRQKITLSSKVATAKTADGKQILCPLKLRTLYCMSLLWI